MSKDGPSVKTPSRVVATRTGIASAVPMMAGVPILPEVSRIAVARPTSSPEAPETWVIPPLLATSETFPFNPLGELKTPKFNSPLAREPKIKVPARAVVADVGSSRVMVSTMVCVICKEPAPSPTPTVVPTEVAEGRMSTSPENRCPPHIALEVVNKSVASMDTSVPTLRFGPLWSVIFPELLAKVTLSRRSTRPDPLLS